jgi:hypothetical protein
VSRSLLAQSSTWHRRLPVFACSSDRARRPLLRRMPIAMRHLLHTRSACGSTHKVSMLLTHLAIL